VSIDAYPLYWPEGWQRTPEPAPSQFGSWNNKPSVAKSVYFLLEELRRMGIPEDDVIISTNLTLRNDGLPYSNQKKPSDCGVSIWWTGKELEQKVIALDKYNTVGCNIWAVGKTIEALRGIDRWGSGEILNRTFKGFTALPPPGGGWCIILQCDGDDFDLAKRNYMRLRSKHHSDNGGDPILFNQVQEAWKECQEHFK